jgi:hypothetical protein
VAAKLGISSTFRLLLELAKSDNESSQGEQKAFQPAVK